MIRLANEQEQKATRRVYLDKTDPDTAWKQLQHLFGEGDEDDAGPRCVELLDTPQMRTPSA
jgi:hypothetical protein